MNTIGNKFQYEVSNRLGTMFSNPLGEADFKIEWQRKDENERDYERTLPSKIIFTGDVYKQMLKLEQSIYRCEMHSISVRRQCNISGVDTWTSWFSGEFSLNECDWDLDRCKVEVKLDETSVSKCINDNDGEDVDLMPLIPTRYLVKTNPPNVTIQKVIMSKSGSSSGLISIYAWNPLAGYGETPEDGGFVPYKNQYSNNGTNWNTVTNWARQVITLTCFDPNPGVGWILIENTCVGLLGHKKYAKPVSVYDCQYNYPPPTSVGVPTEGEIMDCKILGDTDQIFQLKNGMHMKDVLQAFITKFCPGKTVKSNFFQINPDVASAINYVTGLRSKTMNIIVFQKSDVKRPTASSATKAETSFEKFIGAVCLMFNCKWRIIGNDFRIEHVSYFSQTAGLDLTQGVFAKYSYKMRRYTYETQVIPQKEEFLFMEVDQQKADFVGRPIIYSGGCVSKDSKKNIITNSTEIVTTDVQLCISNPDSESKVVSDEGFVFVATETNGTEYWILSENGILVEEQALNNTLAWAQLHRDYHRYNRPLKTGNMNDVQTTFLSVIPTKKGATLKIPLCCGTNFNPDDYMITPLGNGVVDKATFSFKDETLEVDLLYSADEGLVNNLPPVANNDVKKLYLNQTVFINVLANDSDPEGIITAVEITTPPIKGLAVVMPDKTIRYTPFTGITGDDYINYRIMDEWNEPSNIALIAITIFPANTPPVANDDNYSMTMGGVLNVPAPGVLANDSDDVGLTIDSYDTGSAAGGTVVLNPDGSFTYTPITSGYYGTDTFTYTIIDDQGLTDTATVTIEVKNPSFPTAVDDYYQTLEGAALNVLAPGVLANDINPIAGSLTAVPIGLVTPGGGVTVNSNGSFNYTPSVGYTGRDHFDYTVLNSAGSDIGRAYIDVLPFIYIKIEKLNDQTFPITNICNGLAQPGGTRKTADYRISFFSNSSGTVPIDITGLHFRIFIKHGQKTSPSGSFTYDTYELEEASGTSMYIQEDYQYFYDGTDCDGDPTFYIMETFDLDTGMYTII